MAVERDREILVRVGACVAIARIVPGPLTAAMLEHLPFYGTVERCAAGISFAFPVIGLDLSGHPDVAIVQGDLVYLPDSGRVLIATVAGPMTLTGIGWGQLNAGADFSAHSGDNVRVALLHADS